MNLNTVISLKSNPLDEVIVSHRMLDFPNGNMNDVTVTLQFNSRNMLLNGSIN